MIIFQSKTGGRGHGTTWIQKSLPDGVDPTFEDIGRMCGEGIYVYFDGNGDHHFVKITKTTSYKGEELT